MKAPMTTACLRLLHCEATSSLRLICAAWSTTTSLCLTFKHCMAPTSLKTQYTFSRDALVWARLGTFHAISCTCCARRANFRACCDAHARCTSNFLSSLRYFFRRLTTLQWRCCTGSHISHRSLKRYAALC